MPDTTSCTDFITYGMAETHEDGSVIVKSALLPHNARRNLLRPVALTSNNNKKAAFVTTQGLSSTDMPQETGPTSEEVQDLLNPITDFVVLGFAEESSDGIPLMEATTALLDKSSSGCSRRSVPLVSDHARCCAFVTNGLCSVTITTADILWMEKMAECKPGTLFKSFRDAAHEPEAPTEHPWEPLARYKSLCAARVLREPKGAKSTEHLENLRRSEPLINLAAWHDWSILHQQVKNSRPAKVHQQALIDRAMAAHARRTATPPKLKAPITAKTNTSPASAKPQSPKLHAADTKAPWVHPPPRNPIHLIPPSKPFDLPQPAVGVGTSANGLKRSLHLGRLKSIDDTVQDERYGRGERASGDSVMDPLGPLGPWNTTRDVDSTSPPAKDFSYKEFPPSSPKAVATPPMLIESLQFGAGSSPDIDWMTGKSGVQAPDINWMAGKSGVQAELEALGEHSPNSVMMMGGYMMSAGFDQRKAQRVDAGMPCPFDMPSPYTPSPYENVTSLAEQLAQQNLDMIDQQLAQQQFDKSFPPLPKAGKDSGGSTSHASKAIESALNDYKVVSGPGWYSDA